MIFERRNKMWIQRWIPLVTCMVEWLQEKHKIVFSLEIKNKKSWTEIRARFVNTINNTNVIRLVLSYQDLKSNCIFYSFFPFLYPTHSQFPYLNFPTSLLFIHPTTFSLSLSKFLSLNY